MTPAPAQWILDDIGLQIHLHFSLKDRHQLCARRHLFTQILSSLSISTSPKKTYIHTYTSQEHMQQMRINCATQLECKVCHGPDEFPPGFWCSPPKGTAYHIGLESFWLEDRPVHAGQSEAGQFEERSRVRHRQYHCTQCMAMRAW